MKEIKIFSLAAAFGGAFLVFLIIAAGTGTAVFLFFENPGSLPGLTAAAGGGLLAGALAFLLLYLRLRRNIRRLARITGEVAAGKPDSPRIGRTDIREIRKIEAELIEVLGVSISRITGQIEAVKQSSHDINGRVSGALDTSLVSGVEIGGNLKLIEKETNELLGRLSDASAAVEEISANVESFSKEVGKQSEAMEKTEDAVKEMAGSVSNVADITRLRMDSVRELMDITSEGGRRVASTGGAIQEVTSGVAGIGQMITVINDIASQTNLLAMNAAIEAAHAGNSGRGFAVVAGEVRKLAETTAENSKAISASLENIISKITEAQEASTLAGKTFRQIEGEVNRFVESFREISTSTENLAAGTREILSTVSSLREFSFQISSGSTEISGGAAEIERVLRTIKEFSGELLRDISHVSREAADIGGAQSEISLFAVENNKNIKNLLQTFKETSFGNSLPDESDFNMDLATLMHRNWLAQMLAFLEGRKEDLRVTQEDYFHCDLGKWIYGTGQSRKNDLVFKNLEDIHKQFHQTAWSVFDAKQNNDIRLAEENYRKLMDQYKVVISLLEDMEKTIRNASKT